MFETRFLNCIMQFCTMEPNESHGNEYNYAVLETKTLWNLSPVFPLVISPGKESLQSFIEVSNNFCENLAKLPAQSPQPTTFSNELKTFSLHD